MPAPSVEQAVAGCMAEDGPSAPVGVIPRDPYVLPYVAWSSWAGTPAGVIVKCPRIR
jgi:hypothetical protein